MPEQYKDRRHELTTIFLGRLILSAMLVISLKAFIIARSELLIVLRFWYFEFPNSSKLAAPVPWEKNILLSVKQATSSSFQEQTSSSFIHLNSRHSVPTIGQMNITEVNHTIEQCSKHQVQTLISEDNRAGIFSFLMWHSLKNKMNTL